MPHSDRVTPAEVLKRTFSSQRVISLRMYRQGEALPELAAVRIVFGDYFIQAKREPRRLTRAASR